MDFRYSIKHEDTTIPQRGEEKATGYDIKAVAVEEESDVYIKYDTGLCMQAVSDDVDLQLRPRSSIYKTGLFLSNSLGTLDVSYTGKISAVFYKHPYGCEPYKVGDRIGQLVCARFEEINFIIEPMEETKRGDGAYGSTGK